MPSPAPAFATVGDAPSRTCRKNSPIVIDGVTASDRASIDVTFLSDATDVEIRLWGVGGVILDAEPVTGTFAAGQSITFSPALTPGQGGRLAIQVAATVDGRRQNVVSGFEVPAVNGRVRTETVRLDAAGNRVRVLTARMGS